MHFWPDKTAFDSEFCQQKILNYSVFKMSQLNFACHNHGRQVATFDLPMYKSRTDKHSSSFVRLTAKKDSFIRLFAE